MEDLTHGGLVEVKGNFKFAHMLAIYSHRKQVKNPTQLMIDFGSNPLQVINAMHEADRLGLGTVKYDKKGGDGIKSFQPEEVPSSYVIEDYIIPDYIKTLASDIYIAVKGANSRDNDITRDIIHLWAGGETLPPAILSMAVWYLESNSLIETYEQADPKDKKSVYTFLTLPENAGRELWRKQFKSTKK